MGAVSLGCLAHSCSKPCWQHKPFSPKAPPFPSAKILNVDSEVRHLPCQTLVQSLATANLSLHSHTQVQAPETEKLLAPLQEKTCKGCRKLHPN